MNTYRNLKLTTVRSVASSAIFVRNGVVQTTLPTHALRTRGNVFEWSYLLVRAPLEE